MTSVYRMETERNMLRQPLKKKKRKKNSHKFIYISDKTISKIRIIIRLDNSVHIFRLPHPSKTGWTLVVPFWTIISLIYTFFSHPSPHVHWSKFSPKKYKSSSRDYFIHMYMYTYIISYNRFSTHFSISLSPFLFVLRLILYEQILINREFKNSTFVALIASIEKINFKFPQPSPFLIIFFHDLFSSIST